MLQRKILFFVSDLFSHIEPTFADCTVCYDTSCMYTKIFFGRGVDILILNRRTIKFCETYKRKKLSGEDIPIERTL